MARRVVVVGAGINGLVAANFLRRGGAEVVVLEKKEKVGGACTVEWLAFPDGKKYPVPTGASVFGMMQDFVFEQTGLAKRLTTFRSTHPKMVYFGDETEPLYHYDDAAKYAAEMATKWGEHGDIAGYSRDLERVRQFLLGVYREAATPTWELAVQVLGEEIAQRWIRGSAAALFAHYFTADRTKIYESMAVTEAGPVALDEPFTAFTVAVMSAGSVFGGAWGFVKGGLWRLPLALAEANAELGVQLVTGAQIERIDPKAGEVVFLANGAENREKTDAVFFATDPMTAAQSLGDASLLQEMRTKRFLGTSGKVVLVFRDKARWKGDTGKPQFDAAVRYLYNVNTLAEFEEANAAVREARVEYAPSAYQLYVEGGAMRQMGWDEPYDYVSVFFKDMALGRRGVELPDVKADVELRVLSRLENPEAFVGSVLFTPRDLQETFFFPAGNIDHMELCAGQTFFGRTFSAQPEKAFYQLGMHESVFYCGAGSFPSGSVAGTAGAMAAMQWLRRL